MKYCLIHKRKPAKLQILWADGRAFMWCCSAECYRAWIKTTEHAEIIWIKPVTRGANVR